VLLPAAAPAQFNLIAFAMFAVTAGALLATAFDVVAAALFIVPTLAPLVVQVQGVRATAGGEPQPS